MAGGVPESELDGLSRYWAVFSGLRETLFANGGTSYAQLQVENPAETIAAHKSVKAFVKSMRDVLADLPDFLDGELVGRMMQLSVATEENVLAEALLTRKRCRRVLRKSRKRFSPVGASRSRMFCRGSSPRWGRAPARPCCARDCPRTTARDTPSTLLRPVRGCHSGRRAPARPCCAAAPGT